MRIKPGVVAATLLLTLAPVAQAQTAKVELMGSIGYSLSEGINFPGESVDLPGGGSQVFNELDLADGMTYGAGLGYYVNRNVEVAFLWDYQQSELVAKGTTEMKIADLGIDNYHGVVIYNAGSPLDRVRPVLFGGLGATYFRGIDYRNLAGEPRTTSGEGKFSTLWGAGAKLALSPRFAFQLDIKWTPTYVKSDVDGYWCDPYWGCGTVADPDYTNQWKFGGTMIARF